MSIIFHVVRVVVEGARFVGEIARSGIGIAKENAKTRNMENLRSNIAERNRVLLTNLKEDTHARELLASTEADAGLGRMAFPKLIHDLPPSDVLLAPRFSVSQVRCDGSVKIRPVDHFSWSPGRHSKQSMRVDSVNGYTCVSEKMKHDTLDTLWQRTRESQKLFCSVPGLLKIDIDSAFRRIPVAPEDYWATGIVFMLAGQVSLGICLAMR